MENNTFLVFLFAISIGVLFVGSGITGLATSVDEVVYCIDEGDCGSEKVCCAFREGYQVSRICAIDCKKVDSFEKDNYGEQASNVFSITGRNVEEVKGNYDYWIYILIGVVLILLAFFYKKNPEKIIVKKRRKKAKKRIKKKVKRIKKKKR